MFKENPQLVPAQVTMAGKTCPRFFAVRRISKQQQTEGYGLAVQQDDLNSYVVSIPGASIVDGMIVVEPASGWDRAKFSKAVDELIARFHAGEVDACLIPRIDRSSRFVPGSLPLLINVLQLGIPVHFAREQLVLTLDDFDAWDKYLEGADRARNYIRNLQATTFPGQVRAAKAGRMPSGAGKYGLTGYRYDRATRNFVPVPGLIDTVKLILKLALEGKSTNGITDELLSRHLISASGAPFRRQSVHKVVRHARAYAGIYTWGGIEILELIPPIISEAEAAQIISRLKRNKEKSLGFGRRKWLTGRVFCSLCGRRWVMDSSKKRCSCRGADRHYYVPPCMAPRISYKTLESQVWRALVEAWTSDDVLVQAAAEQRKAWLSQRESGQSRRQELESATEELGKRRRQLSFQHEHRGLSDKEYIERLNDILGQEEEINRQVEDLILFDESKEPPDPELVRSTLAMTSRFPIILLAKDEEKSDMADELGLRVVVHPSDESPGWRLDVRFDLPLINSAPVSTEKRAPFNYLPVLVSVVCGRFCSLKTIPFVVPSQTGGCKGDSLFNKAGEAKVTQLLQPHS